MTDGIFMHRCAQTIPSGGKMNELQLCTSMLLTHHPPHTHTQTVEWKKQVAEDSYT